MRRIEKVFTFVGEVVTFVVLVVMLLAIVYAATHVIRAAPRGVPAPDTHLVVVEHHIAGETVVEIVDAEHGVRCYFAGSSVHTGVGLSCVKEVTSAARR